MAIAVVVGVVVVGVVVVVVVARRQLLAGPWDLPQMLLTPLSASPFSKVKAIDDFNDLLIVDSTFGALFQPSTHRSRQAGHWAELAEQSPGFTK